MAVIAAGQCRVPVPSRHAAFEKDIYIYSGVVGGGFLIDEVEKMCARCCVTSRFMKTFVIACPGIKYYKIEPCICVPLYTLCKHGYFCRLIRVIFPNLHKQDAHTDVHLHRISMPPCIFSSLAVV